MQYWICSIELLQKVMKHLANIQILVKAPVRNNLVVRTVFLQASGESISTQCVQTSEEKERIGIKLLK